VTFTAEVLHTNVFSFRNLLFVCAAINNRLRGRALYSVAPGHSEGSRGGCPPVQRRLARVVFSRRCTALSGTAPPGRAAAETGRRPGYAGRSVGAALPGSLVLDPMTTCMPFGAMAMGRSWVGAGAVLLRFYGHCNGGFRAGGLTAFTGDWHLVMGVW
jgi:hypothetical protein